MNLTDTRRSAIRVVYGVKSAFGLPGMPPLVGQDVISKDELGAYLRVEQDLGKWVSVALRWDYYSPDTAQRDDGSLDDPGWKRCVEVRDMRVYGEDAFPASQTSFRIGYTPENS